MIKKIFRKKIMRLMAAYSYLRFAVVITTASPLLAWADNGEETATHLQQQQWLLQQQREKQIWRNLETRLGET